MNRNKLSKVVGAAIATSLTGWAQAGENPFAVRELPAGYQLLAEAGKESKEMVCGEGKCGGQMIKSPEMNCGAMKAEAEKKAAESKKMIEGKCAGMKMDTSAPTTAAPPKAP